MSGPIDIKEWDKREYKICPIWDWTIKYSTFSKIKSRGLFLNIFSTFKDNMLLMVHTTFTTILWILDSWNSMFRVSSQFTHCLTNVLPYFILNLNVINNRLHSGSQISTFPKVFKRMELEEQGLFLNRFQF